ncbi:MAG: tRNA (adenosine(37)-N6)-threonylcarbamoyltransferase complex dimerization subunit type 1 TsaB [Clostridia bacterium]|nr:tRNA (adenosine(37)-N6)-threonylcarbamoyltransferase complex dimerization subunit type 1 TsaB [Clostridia bacterium]
MLILALDASSQAATAALLLDGAILCEYTQNQPKTQSVKLLPMIEQMLSDCDLTLPDIDVFSCGVGPGSFTGVRIGVATARGFAKTLDRPCVAVDSLTALAENVSAFSGRVYALIFAREGECYCAAFENEKEILSPCVMTVEEIAAHAKDEACLLVGDGAECNKDFFKTALPKANIAKGKDNMLSAASLGQVAYKMAMAGKMHDCEGLIPLYLRKSQAEREYEAKHSQDK